MEYFVEQLMEINEPKTLFFLCGVFVFTDMITGYLKAFKTKKVNSSISHDGYIKKVAWSVSLLLGFLVDYLVKVDIFLIGSSMVCIATEGVSVYENLGELGINLPFKKYFEKIKEID